MRSNESRRLQHGGDTLRGSQPANHELTRPNVLGDRRCAALSRSVQRAKRTGSTGGLGLWVAHAGRQESEQAPARTTHGDGEKRSHRHRKLHRLRKSRRWRYGDHGALTKKRGERKRHGQPDRATADGREPQRNSCCQGTPKLATAKRVEPLAPQKDRPKPSERKEREPPPHAPRAATKARRDTHSPAPPQASATARTANNESPRNDA